MQCVTDFEHLYRIYSIPTHDKHQWPLLEFIVLLMMDAKGVRNMYSILVVINKHIWLVYYTDCPRRNVPDFGRVFLMLNYTDITQNTYAQS